LTCGNIKRKSFVFPRKSQVARLPLDDQYLSPESTNLSFSGRIIGPVVTVQLDRASFDAFTHSFGRVIGVEDSVPP